MKILFVGQPQPPSRSWQRMRVFQELGHEVQAVDTVGTAPAAARALIDRLLWKAGWPRDQAGANKAILNAAAGSCPDLVWIEKGNTIRKCTLERLKASCPDKPLVAFSEDDMYLRHNRSAAFARSLSVYDAVITTKSYNCAPNELPALGARRVVFVNNTFDAGLHRPRSVSEAERSRLGADVGFVGTFEKERARSIVYLAQNGIDVRVRGLGGWNSLANRYPHLDARDEAWLGEDYVGSICSTRINLCFLRKVNRDLQTSRTMEIPACAGFMLAERTDEHKALFLEGEEAEFFSSDAELLMKVRHYLANDEQRRRIATAGRIRCERSGYSIQTCLAYLVSTLCGEDGAL